MSGPVAPGRVPARSGWIRTGRFAPSSNPLPTVTIEAAPAKVPAGTDAKFTLTRTGSTAAALPVTVEVTGAAVSGTPPTSVTIPKDADEATFTVATLANSAEGEQVTAKVGAGTGYVVGTPSSATVRMLAPPVISNFRLNDAGHLSADFTWGKSDAHTVQWELEYSENPPFGFVQVVLKYLHEDQDKDRDGVQVTFPETGAQAPGLYHVRGRVCEKQAAAGTERECGGWSGWTGRFKVLSQPTNLQWRDLTFVSVIVDYNLPSGVTASQVRLGADGAPTAPNGGTTAAGGASDTSSTSFSHKFDGLSPGKSYTLYVRSTGPDGALSAWKTLVVETPPTLSALSLSSVTLSPTFASATLAYTARVSHSVSRTTVAATATDSDATVSIRPTDADNDATNGHQVNLTSGGKTTITVTVAAANDGPSSNYTVAVSRASAPPPPKCTLTVTAGTGGTASGGGEYNCYTWRGASATANAGREFSHWSGDASGSANPVNIYLNVSKSVHANFSCAPAGAQPDPEEETRDEGDEFRWVMSGVLELEEKADVLQDYTRSATYNDDIDVCAYEWGDWQSDGESYLGPYTATGNRRCKTPLPAEPPASGSTVLQTSYRWEVRGTSPNRVAHQQKNEEKQNWTRTVEWVDVPTCGWNTGEPEDDGDAYWTGWSDTGTTKAEPDDPPPPLIVPSTKGRRRAG